MPRVGLAPVVQLPSRELARETRKRAANWALYSFSNSLYFEDNLILKDYRIKPNELIEVNGMWSIPIYRCAKVSLSRSIVEEDSTLQVGSNTMNPTSTRWRIMGVRKANKKPASERSGHSVFVLLLLPSISRLQCRNHRLLLPVNSLLEPSST